MKNIEENKYFQKDKIGREDKASIPLCEAIDTPLKSVSEDLGDLMRIRILSICMMLAAAMPALLIGPPVQAATTTSQFQVSLTLQAACTVTSASDLAFGTGGVLTSAITATSIINVECTNTTPYNIGLGVGTGSGATVAARKMTAGAATITYGLYRDSAHTQIWGDTVSTNTAPGTGNGTAQPYTVYGLVPAQTTPLAGNYVDTVQITVTY